MRRKVVFAIVLTALFLSSCGKEQEQKDTPIANMTAEQTESGTGTETQSSVGTGLPEALKEKEKENPQKQTEESKTSGGTETSGPEDTAASGSGKQPKEDGNTAEGKPEKKPAESGQSETPKKPGNTGTQNQTGDTGKTANTQPSAPHTTCNWDGGKVTAGADCNHAGVKTFTCTVCGKTRTETVPQTSHNYTTDTKAATCTEGGYTKTYCTICGNVQSETSTAATGHSMLESWFNQPTCNSAGDGHVNKCSRCRYVEPLPDGAPLGHVPDAGTVLYDSTYTSTGLIEHKCTRCRANLDDEIIPVKPHEHHWVLDEDGFTEYCDICYSGR